MAGQEAGQGDFISVGSDPGGRLAQPLTSWFAITGQRSDQRLQSSSCEGLNGAALEVS